VEIVFILLELEPNRSNKTVGTVFVIFLTIIVTQIHHMQRNAQNIREVLNRSLKMIRLSDLKRGDEILRCRVFLKENKLEDEIFDETKIFAVPQPFYCFQFKGENNLYYHPNSYCNGVSVGDDYSIRGWSHRIDLDILKNRLSNILEEYIRHEYEKLHQYLKVNKKELKDD
jgi:hypothetical protein